MAPCSRVSTGELIDAIPDFTRIVVDQPITRGLYPYEFCLRSRFDQLRGIFLGLNFEKVVARVAKLVRVRWIGVCSATWLT